jgi:hypothetical protein
MDDIPYRVRLGTSGIPQLKLQWCERNCISKWGWFFLDETAYIGFADDNEMLWYCLSNEYV